MSELRIALADPSPRVVSDSDDLEMLEFVVSSAPVVDFNYLSSMDNRSPGSFKQALVQGPIRETH